MKFIHGVSKLLIASMLLTACGEESYNKETMFLNVPVINDQGEMTFNKVEVPTATDFKSLSGEHVDFKLGLVDFELIACEGSGEENLRLSSYRAFSASVEDYCSGIPIGNTPSFRFIREGNTFTPTGDFNTLVASSLYYHSYKVKEIIEPYKDMVPNLYPIKIHLAVPGTDDNAASYAGFNFLAFGYGNLPKLPVSLSPIVQYHEISHSIFYQVLEQSLTEKYSSGYAFRYLFKKGRGRSNYTSLRSINEGLADLFAYIVTGQTDILGYTHSEYHAEDRNLDIKKPSFRPSGNDPYDKGQYFAKMFIELSLAKRKIKNLKPSLVAASTRSEFIEDYFSFIKTKVTELYEGGSISDRDIEGAIEKYFQDQIEKVEKGKLEEDKKELNQSSEEEPKVKKDSESSESKEQEVE